MANFGSPAHNAAMGNLPGMMLVAGGAMCLARGVSDALDAVAEARYRRQYHDALGAASAHARELENVARVAVTLIAELEVEVAGLRTACAQRQEVIEALVGRA
ncbi:hypothetical protein ASD54_08615 [Rhizobium sp. Root149]|uniref:hypothetical protein n=1 Tax=Rhizobium sp. Root149 TaxID=1736473 RepID=UPI000715BCD8|nr:hypothetical protein [Rhizobium sp. Root149]KQZ50307.1 hypothetical protein ASD54_08615 [Rhizobium sp. Root149]